VITILTSTLNSGLTLPPLIESLRAQTDRSFQWIVIDGGSTDETLRLLRDCGDVLSHWISEPDFGIYHALNKGLALATGEYYLVVGSDDTLERDAVAAFGKAARATQADIIAAPVFSADRLTLPRRRFAGLRSGPPFVAAHSVGTLIRRSLHDEIGLYSRRFPIAADTQFLLQVAQRHKRFAYIDTAAGRFGGGGASSNDTLGALCESWRAHVEIRGTFWLQLPVFAARLLINGPRIARQVGRRAAR
jgi:glycosyltransferase involved in cell wall biosynthesis